MRIEKHIALQIKDLLTMCLADAIEKSMLAQAGSNWFTAFKKYDATPECKTPIIHPNQASIYDCDMQALLKILRYREPYAEAILKYYGFYDPNDQYGNTIRRGHFTHLINRLITDFRNRMEAHTRATDLAGTAQSEMLYDYTDAVNDMLKLAKIFSGVKGKNGVSYYKQMLRLAHSKNRKKMWITAAVMVLVVTTGIGGVLWTILGRGAEKDESDPITLTPVTYSIREDGGLNVVCKLKNNLDKEIYNICISDFVLGFQPNTLLSEKDFSYLYRQNTGLQSGFQTGITMDDTGLLNGAEGLVLEANKEILYTFTFESEYLCATGDDLEAALDMYTLSLLHYEGAALTRE